MPSRVLYAHEELETGEFSGLAKWIREAPFTCIEVHPKMPVTCIVAILDEMLRAGMPLPAIGKHFPSSESDRPPPSEEVRSMNFLPYPTRIE